MPRILVGFTAVIFAVLSACSRREPVAEPATEPSAPSTASAVSPPPASSTSVAPPAASANASRARQLIASYLTSDGHGGWRKDEQAATELEKLPADETAQIWPLLKDQDANIRRAAAVYVLPQFDESNSHQVEAFTALLDDSDAFVRARALDAARQFLTADRIAALTKVTALLDVRREERADNRAAGARFCGGLKKDARPALPAVETAAVSDPDAKVRSAAATAAAQIADAPEAAGLLKKLLADKDASVRLVAAARLRQLGREAAPASHELAAALADSNQDVAEAAAEALIRVGAPAVEPLAGQLASSSATTRKLALACLAKLGQAAKPAASRIEKCNQDADPEVRQLADVALKSLGLP